MSLVSEFSKRNVFRVGAAYLVTAWLLTQVAETIFPLFGFGDTPARIVVVVLAIGFIPALILARAFRLTPEGFRKESDLDVALSPTASRRLDQLIMIVLTIAVCVMALDRFVFSSMRSSSGLAEIAKPNPETLQQAQNGTRKAVADARSIVVLLFVNMSDEARNEFFSDGISEELLNLLAKIPELRVISRIMVSRCRSV